MAAFMALASAPVTAIRRFSSFVKSLLCSFLFLYFRRSDSRRSTICSIMRLHSSNISFSWLIRPLNIFAFSVMLSHRMRDVSILSTASPACDIITCAFSRFSSAFILAVKPVNNTTGAATAASGAKAAPTALPAMLAAVPTSPIESMVPAKDAPSARTGSEPPAANRSAAPAAVSTASVEIALV